MRKWELFTSIELRIILEILTADTVEVEQEDKHIYRKQIEEVVAEIKIREVQ